MVEINLLECRVCGQDWVDNGVMLLHKDFGEETMCCVQCKIKEMEDKIADIRAIAESYIRVGMREQKIAVKEIMDVLKK